MNEEAIKERFEELEKTIEIYKQLVDTLRGDFELLVAHSPIAKGSILSAAAKEGLQHFDQAEAKDVMCLWKNTEFKLANEFPSGELAPR
jgi:hypothetical protein